MAVSQNRRILDLVLAGHALDDVGEWLQVNHPAVLAALADLTIDATTQAQRIFNLIAAGHSLEDVGSWLNVTTATVTAALQDLSGATTAPSDSVVSAVSPSGNTTGVTDTAAIQAKLTALAAGGTVALGPGTFYINATLLMPSNVILQGAGRSVTVLQLAAGVNAPLLLSQNFASLTLGGSITAGEHTFSLRDLTLDGNASGQSVAAAQGVGIYGYDFELKRVAIRNFKAIDGLYTEWGTLGGGASSTLAEKAMEAAFSDVRIHDNTLTGAGWHFRGPHDSMIDKVIIYNNTTSAIGFWNETTANTTVAAGSNGVNVNTFAGAGVLNVASVIDFPSSGTLTVATTGGTATIAYTGTAGGNSFTGCNCTSGTNGTMATGGAVTGPQYSGSAPLINQLHVWGSHAIGCQLDASGSKLVNCELEGASTGQLLLRGGDNSLHGGRVFNLTQNASYGITIGDTVNKASGNVLGDPEIYNFAGAAGSSAAINFVNPSSGKYSASIFQPSGQAIWGAAANNERRSFSFSGGTTFPAVAAAAGVGTSPPAPTVSNASDRRGGVNIGTGTTTAAGSAVTVTYAQPKAGNPMPTLAPGNAATAALQPYVSGSSTTAFTIGFALAPAASQATGTYVVNFASDD